MYNEAVAALLAGAENALGATVEFVEQLSGGTHALTVAISSEGESLVVRTFPPGDEAVAREVDVHGKISPLGGLVPEYRAKGQAGSRPLIITSRLPGGPPAPHIPVSVIARSMASLLARIHAVDPEGLRRFADEPKSGSTAIARLAHEAWHAVPDAELVLTHHDFWSGNTLWVGEQLTGVIDWSGACMAPRGVDVAWCRQDLMLLGEPAAADLFLQEYEARAGVTVASINAWDVLAAWSAEPRIETWAPNYAGIGRSEITAAVLRERLTAWNTALTRPRGPTH